MKRILFFFATFTLLSFSAFSQGSDCADATPFCGNVTFPNNTATSAEAGPSYGCLVSEPNPAWFIIKTTAAGSMVFNISQSTGGGSAIDVDFIAWGPFSSTANICNNLTGSCTGDHLCSGNIEDCSYNPAATETMTLASPSAGQYYVIMITNYSGQAGNITFNQTSGPATDCSITCPSVTAGNGYLLSNGSNMPATVACNAANFALYASTNTPFGNPITPAIIISFTSNTNTTLQTNWYENAVFMDCFGPGAAPAAGSCGGGTIPVTTNNDEQISFMSPSLPNTISLCETSTVDGDFPYTIVDAASGVVLSSGTWVTDAACLNINIPAGTISGVSSWAITSVPGGTPCPGCLSSTDWGATVFSPGAAAAAGGSGTWQICYSFDPPGACPTYTYCQNITVTNPNSANWTAPASTMCSSAAAINLNTLVTGTAGGTWSISPASGALSGSTFNPALATNGTLYTITYTVGGAGCQAIQSHTTTVSTSPTVSAAGPDQSVCATTATLAGNVAASGVGTWTLVGGAGTITTPSSPTSGVTALGVGANTFQWTIANAPCPSTSDQVIITRMAPPTVAAAGPDQTVCGTTATFAGNAAAIGAGTWTLVSGAGTITTPSSPTSGVTALGVGANTFQWTITNAPCPSTNDQIVITRVASPTVAAAGPDQSVCGTTATFAGNAAAVGTGTWTLISGSGTITSPSSPTSGITALGVGANVFQWTIANAPCPATSDQVTITGVAAPTAANAGPDQTICATTATLAGNAAATGAGTWTLVSGAGTITSPSSPTSGLTALGIGANVFQWTIANAPCPATSDQVTINRSNPPTVAAAGPDQSVCGTTATFAGNAAAVGSGTWTLISGSGTITSPSTPNSGVTGLGIGANVFQWTIANAPCPATTDQITITGVATPTVANAGPDQTLCGTTATLAGNTAAIGTGTWTLISGSGTITAPGAAGSGVTGLAMGANVFQWTIANAPCPSTSDQVTINITSAPTAANAGPDQSVCGTTATFAGNAAGAGTGTWTLISGAGTITSPSTPNSGVTGLGTGANVFQWTINNAPCTPSSDQVTITGVASPTAANAGPDQSVCGTTATLAGNTAATGTGTWTLVSGAGVIIAPSSPNSGITGLGAGANVFQWTIANSPCPATNDQVTITGTSTPTVANAGPDQTVCGTTATLAGNAAAAGTGTWTLVSGSGTITTPSSPTSGITGLGIGANTFQWTIANAPCPATNDQVTITGTASPTVAAAGPDQTLCVTTATLAANIAATGTGTWTLVSGAGTITSPSSPNTTVTALGTGANVFQWTIANAPCPATSDQVTINVNAPDNSTFSYASSTYCQTGTDPSATITGLAGGTFSSTAGLVFLSTSSGSIDLSASTLGSYTITYATNGPCPTTSTFNITITNAPTGTFSYAGPYCTGGTNPFPTFGGGSSAGTFSSTAGLVFANASTGEIDLAASTAGTYTITNSIAAGGGCSAASANNTVTINPAAIANAGADGSVCSGGTYTLSGAVSGGGTTLNWSSATGGTFDNASLPNATYTPSATDISAGTVTLTLTTNDPAGPCGPVTDAIVISITPLDNAGFNYSPSTFCQTGTNPVPTVTGIAGGTFSSTAGLVFVSTVTGEIDLAGSTLGTYTITYTTNGTCPNTSTATVTITTSPSAMMSYTGPYCQAGGANPLPAFGAGASGGVFSSTAGLVFVSTSTGEVDLSSSTPGTYTITNTIAAGGGCAAATDNATIIIDPPATANAGLDASVCNGSTYTLSGSIGGAATTLTWSSTSGGTFDNPNIGGAIYTPSAADLAAGTATIHITSDDPSGACGMAVDSMILTITPLDNASFSYSGSTFCATGTNPVPTVTGVAGGTFSSTAGLVFVSTSTGEIDLAGSTLGTYTVTYTTGGICPNTATQTITLTNSPVATFDFTASDTAFCSSGTNPIPVFAGGASAGTFAATPSGLVFVSTSTGEVNLSGSTPGAYTLTNTIVASGGCATTSDTLNITISPAAIANAGSDATICSGSPYTLSGASIGGSATTPTWATSGSGTFDNTALIGATYTPSSADSTAGSVTLYVTTDDPAGICGSVVDSMVLSITPLPLAPMAMSPAAYCAGSVMSAIVATVGGGTINWYSDAALTTLIFTGNPFSPPATLGSTSYWITETVGACISTATQVTVIVNALPVADTSAVVITPASCGDTTGTVTGVTITSGLAPFTYQWTNSAGTVVGTSLTLSGVGPGVYTLTVVDANGCMTTIGSSSLTNVTSTSGVTAGFTATPTTGEKPLLVNFTNTSTTTSGTLNYLWQFGNGDTSSTANPAYIFNQLGNFTVCLIAENGAGCSDTACSDFDIYINSVFMIPNVFTPNDDNSNDIFTVQAVGLKTMDAEIYNRWGQKEYEWHTTNGGWDGRTASGVLAPDGTYFFIIKATGFDGKEYFEKGPFTLIR